MRFCAIIRAMKGVFAREIGSRLLVLLTELANVWSLFWRFDAEQRTHQCSLTTRAGFVENALQLGA